MISAYHDVTALESAQALRLDDLHKQLAVAASDRNDERAPFSQSGDFVGVAAPGVDVVSTVPKGGQCVDNGTSFSAPQIAGLASYLWMLSPTPAAGSNAPLSPPPAAAWRGLTDVVRRVVVGRGDQRFAVACRSAGSR